MRSEQFEQGIPPRLDGNPASEGPKKHSHPGRNRGPHGHLLQSVSYSLPGRLSPTTCGSAIATRVELPPAV
jgi:hypothetical protein